MLSSRCRDRTSIAGSFLVLFSGVCPNYARQYTQIVSDWKYRITRKNVANGLCGLSGSIRPTSAQCRRERPIFAETKIETVTFFGFTCNGLLGYPPPPREVCESHKARLSPNDLPSSVRRLCRCRACGWRVGMAFRAMAEDFRVDNVASVDGQKGPPSESTTIFRGGAVYDFMTSPAETVVFDEASGSFTLLNLKLRSRAELTTSELAAFSDRLQQLAARSPEPVIKFLAVPQFQERFDAASGKLSLSSQWVTYRLELNAGGQSGGGRTVSSVLRLACRVNVLLLPGSRPPFARLAVNEAMVQRKSLPSRVVLTIASGKSISDYRPEHPSLGLPAATHRSGSGGQDPRVDAGLQTGQLQAIPASLNCGRRPLLSHRRHNPLLPSFPVKQARQNTS